MESLLNSLSTTTPSIIISGTKDKLDSQFTIFAVYVIDIHIAESCVRIYRRFNQFEALDTELRITYPKELFPELPRKRLFKSSTDKNVVSSRVPLLQKYINEIIKMGFVTKTQIFKNWISPLNNPLFLSLDNPDFAGVLIKQGHLVRNWKERYFLLKEDLLYYFRSREDISPLGVIPLRNSTIENAFRMKPLCFKITPASTSKLQPFFIQAQTKKDFVGWVEMLTAAIQRFSTPTTLRNQEQHSVRETRRTHNLLTSNNSTDLEQLSTSLPTSAMRNIPLELQSPRGNDSPRPGESTQSPNAEKRTGGIDSPWKIRAANQAPAVGSPLATNRTSPNTFHHDGTSLASQSVTGKISLTQSQNRVQTPTNPPESVSIPERRRIGSDSYLVEESSYEERIKFKMKLRAENQNLSIEDQIITAKQSVDDELVEFISTINLELVKSQFLGPKTENKTRQSSENLLLTLKGIAENFLTISANELGENDRCKSLIQRIQYIASQCPRDAVYKHYVTGLLFIISPVSRLLLYQRYESKRSQPSSLTQSNINENSSPNQPKMNQEQNQTTLAISICIRMLLGGLGVSFISTLQQIQTKSIVGPKPRRDSNLLLAKRSNSKQLTNDPATQTRKTVEKLLKFTSNESNLLPDENTIKKDETAKPVNFICEFCGENLAFHIIHEHTKYCQDLATAIPIYPPTTDSAADYHNITNIDHEQFIDFIALIRSMVIDFKCTQFNDKISLRSSSNYIMNYRLPGESATSSPKRQFDPSSTIETLQLMLETIDYFITYTPSPSSNSAGDAAIKEKLNKLLTIRKSWKDSPDGFLFAASNILYKLISLTYENISKIDRKELISPSIPSVTKKNSIKDFIKIKPISRGAFGRVDLVQHKETDQIYAMKTLKKRDMVAKNLVDQVKIERHILSSLQNPYIVKMYYAFHTDSKLYLLMEYLPGGDCASLLENVGCFEESMAKLYIAETIMAIDYVHSQNIVHRDVKPDNLLISADGHIKLTDFGLSLHGMIERSYDSNQTTFGSYEEFGSLRRSTMPHTQPTTATKHRVVGTPDYLSPEALLGTGGGKPTIDWWAVGVTLFEFLTGIPPFNDDTPELIFKHILDRDIPWPDDEEESMSANAKDLIDKLLEPDPQKRLGAKGVDEIKAHPFFENINWDTLYLESRTTTFIPKFNDRYDTGYFINRNANDDSFADLIEDNSPHCRVDVTSSFSGSKRDVWAGWSWMNLPSIEHLEKENVKLHDSASNINIPSHSSLSSGDDNCLFETSL